MNRIAIMLLIATGFMLGLAAGLTRAPAVVEHAVLVDTPCEQPTPESL